MKQVFRRAVRALGYDIRRIAAPSNNIVGQDPWDDMTTFVSTGRPVIFDVGANVGQSVKQFRSRFPHGILHSFEPSPSTFEKLRKNCGDLSGVHLWNCALGAHCGHQNFLENFRSDMSSFLPLGDSGWGEVIRESLVQVDTVDSFCGVHEVERIDILKSDTQGYEYEVLKGCDKMMRMEKISLVYFEVIFSDMYRGIASFGEVYEFLKQREFRLVSFYDLWYPWKGGKRDRCSFCA